MCLLSQLSVFLDQVKTLSQAENFLAFGWPFEKSLSTLLMSDMSAHCLCFPTADSLVFLSAVLHVMCCVAMVTGEVPA